jgi:hypothetical protein
MKDAHKLIGSIFIAVILFMLLFFIAVQSYNLIRN